MEGAAAPCHWTAPSVLPRESPSRAEKSSCRGLGLRDACARSLLVGPNFLQPLRMTGLALCNGQSCGQRDAGERRVIAQMMQHARDRDETTSVDRNAGERLDDVV